MGRRTITWAVLGLTALGLVGCSTSSWTAREMTPGAGEAANVPLYLMTPVAGKPANVLLYLSNQSSARPSVTMSVYVDGQLALRRAMRDVMAGGKHGFPAEFKLRLPPGPHAIRVVAEGLAVSATADVVVGAETVYVDAGYDYWPERHGVGSPGEISIHVGHERPGFC